MSSISDLERVSGPFNGFYIMSSAVAYGDCWIGQAKLYDHRPESGKDPSYELFIGGDSAEQTAGEAMLGVEQRARAHILSCQPNSVGHGQPPPTLPLAFLRPAFFDVLDR